MAIGVKDRAKHPGKRDGRFMPKYASKPQKSAERIARSVNLAGERERMVQRLISEGLLRSPEVIAALRKVPRELFVPDELRPYAYNDTPLPTDRGQTISAPHGMRGRAIHGGDHERSLGAEDWQQSVGGGCWQWLPRRHNRRTSRTPRSRLHHRKVVGVSC